MVFSGFSHLSRNFLANFREGARKRLNLAENWGGLGTIRDDLGSCPKVLKTVCLTARGFESLFLRQEKPQPSSVEVFQFYLLCKCRGSPTRRMSFGGSRILSKLGVIAIAVIFGYAKR